MREELEQLRTRCKGNSYMKYVCQWVCSDSALVELESRAAGRDTSVDEETVARFSREMEQASR